MQQLHDEHAAALWGYCLRLTGYDRPGPRTSCRRRCCAPGGSSPHLDESQGSVRAWLFRVARNIVIDEWRTKRSQSEVAVAEPDEGREPDRTDQVLLSWVVADALTRLRGAPCGAAGVLLPRPAGRRGLPPARRTGRHREVPHALRSARAAPGARGDGGRGMSDCAAFAHLDAAYVLGALSPGSGSPSSGT